MPRDGLVARGRTYVRLALEERFWSKVDKNGPVPAHRPELGPCWLWTGASLRNGYGCIRSEERKTITAHLASWLISGARKPDSCRELCHECDVRRCVRPSHLFEGTRAENMRDAAAKGRLAQQRHPERMPRGSRHHQAKLTEEKVLEIRKLAIAGSTPTALASLFGVSIATIGYVVRRRIWRHVA